MSLWQCFELSLFNFIIYYNIKIFIEFYLMQLPVRTIHICIGVPHLETGKQSRINRHKLAYLPVVHFVKFL